jgi:predicted porin
MKKHLIAAAVAAAIAAPAMAQNVTLYGTIDAGLASLSNVGASNTTGKSAAVFTDGALSSSVWGIRGSEDLGGGLRAIFNFEGDLSTNNGTQSGDGLFRRASNIGLAGGFGTVELGVKMNPLIATASALMTTAGNSVSTMQSAALGFSDFFTRNAITYTSPNMSGLTVQVQHGMSNQSASGGDMTGFSALYASGPLEIRVAGQERNGPVATSGAHWNGAVRPAVASGTVSDKSTYVAGIKATLGAWQVAAAMYSNEYNTTTTEAKTKRESTGLSASYQMNPATRLGVARMTSEGSTLTHVQARYTLSKRTQMYAVAGQADHKGTTAYFPYASNTNYFSSAASAAPIFGDATPGSGGALNAKQKGYGVGIIHSF